MVFMYQGLGIGSPGANLCPLNAKRLKESPAAKRLEKALGEELILPVGPWRCLLRQQGRTEAGEGSGCPDDFTAE